MPSAAEDAVAPPSRRKSQAPTSPAPPVTRRRTLQLLLVFVTLVLIINALVGERQEILIWIERRPGALWAVGRTIDLGNRRAPGPRPDDYVFEGYEMGDALSAANRALRDDLEVSAEEGLNAPVRPFAEEELLKPLERWFFGHKP